MRRPTPRRADRIGAPIVVAQKFTPGIGDAGSRSEIGEQRLGDDARGSLACGRASVPEPSRGPATADNAPSRNRNARLLTGIVLNSRATILFLAGPGPIGRVAP